MARTSSLYVPCIYIYIYNQGFGLGLRQRNKGAPWPSNLSGAFPTGEPYWLPLPLLRAPLNWFYPGGCRSLQHVSRGPGLSKIPGQLPRGLADLFGGDRASILRFLFFVAYLAVIGLSTAFILWLCYLAGQVYAFSDCPDCHSCFDHWGFQRLLLPGGVLCAEQELWPATSGTCTALVRRH